MFRNACIANKWWTTGQRTTHFLMEGGKLNVPESDYERFLQTYLECVQHEPIGLVELKTLHFPMFVDLDYKTVYSDEQILRHAALLNETIQHVVDFETRVLIQRRADDTTSGVHLFVPAVKVTRAIGKELAESFVMRLKEKEDFDEKQVDMRMYSQTGMRLGWSTKFKDKQAVGRIYTPFKWHDGTAILESPHEVLRLCSLRLADFRAEVNIKAEPVMSRGKAGAMVRWIKRAFSVQFTSHKLRRSGKHYILNCNSKFCHNIQKEHKNANIYFVIKQSGVVQRCFCKCTCEHYASPSVALPLAIQRELFDIEVSTGMSLYNVASIPTTQLVEFAYGPQKRPLMN